MNNNPFLGIVRDGRFKVLASDHDVSGSYRLTTISTQAAQTPESGEVPLIEYEGSAILVRGVENGEWIYSASVIEKAGYILTIVVQQVFNSKDGGRGHTLPFPWA